MNSSEATEIISDLASQQWGLVTAAQAKVHGVDQPSLRRLVSRGVLLRMRHGVYATSSTTQTSELEVKAHWLALRPAVMAADRVAEENLESQAVVSHGTAAELWGIGDLWSDGIHFTVPDRRQSRQTDVFFHRTDLEGKDWTVHRGLPVTTAVRTIADLARAGNEPEHLLTLIADAARKQLVEESELLDQLSDQAQAFGVSNRSELKNTISICFPKVQHNREDLGRITDAINESLKPLYGQLSLISEHLNIHSGVNTPALSKLARQVSTAGRVADIAGDMSRWLPDIPTLSTVSADQETINVQSPYISSIADVVRNSFGIDQTLDKATATRAASTTTAVTSAPGVADTTDDKEEVELLGDENEDHTRANHQRSEETGTEPGDAG